MLRVSPACAVTLPSVASDEVSRRPCNKVLIGAFTIPSSVALLGDAMAAGSADMSLTEDDAVPLHRLDLRVAVAELAQDLSGLRAELLRRQRDPRHLAVVADRMVDEGD